ncbi:sporulation protein Rmd8p [Trichomonascus vanleenenianus]|uniref:Rmd8p n=1 Tax=Trichomonascus vanleenenianus TaxID=2268995 RepID=UPI003ECABE5D
MDTSKASMARRSPSILVTDARVGNHRSAPFVRKGQQAPDQRKGNKKGYTRSSSPPSQRLSAGPMNPQAHGHFSRFDPISIDNLLSDVSEIPSAQRRLPPQAHLRLRQAGITSPSTSRTGVTSSSAAPLSGAATASGRRNSIPMRLKPNIPSRTTKLSEKLVLIPEEGSPLFKFEDEDEEDHPPKVSEDIDRVDNFPRRSYAERMPKERRTEKFPRVTAYCVADGIRLNAAAAFLRGAHKIRPRIYDEALFAPYYLPLLPGDDDNGVRVSRVKSSPGGIALLERLINRSEQGDHHYEYFSGLETPSQGGSEAHDGWTAENEEFDPSEPQDFTPPRTSGWEAREEETPQVIAHHPDPEEVSDPVIVPSIEDAQRQEEASQAAREEEEREQAEEDANEHERKRQQRHAAVEDLKHAEMYIFAYGVIVFWNFTERQEKDVLADLTFARVPVIPTEDDDPLEIQESQMRPLVVRPIHDQDIETEEMHFVYAPDTLKPRIYNDMITLKSGDHMIKLAMSHAIAQSTKLSRFEARMDVNMHDVKHVPRMLALTGKLGLKREEVLKISGKLFKLRVDVNLSSNVLDTPEFFWEDEPSLNPLYTAVREYLEIEQRILVINERCKVFLELTDIIADSIAESNMVRITWIIIILIALSLGVSSLEIALRYTILSK